MEQAINSNLKYYHIPKVKMLVNRSQTNPDTKILAFIWSRISGQPTNPTFSWCSLIPQGNICLFTCQPVVAFVCLLLFLFFVFFENDGTIVMMSSSRYLELNKILILHLDELWFCRKLLSLLT